MKTPTYFDTLNLQALQHAFNTIAGQMEEKGITEDDLLWFTQVCSLFNVTYQTAVLPFGLYGSDLARFHKVQRFVTSQVFPNNNLAVSDLIYNDCICSLPIIGLGGGRMFVLSGRRCRHIEQLASILSTLIAMEPDMAMAEHFGLTDDELTPLLEQLRHDGFIESFEIFTRRSPWRYKAVVSGEGYNVSVMVDQLLGHTG